MIGGKVSGSQPSDMKLYKSVKSRVKSQFQKKSRWPSAYGSAHLVKQYKKAFSKKHGSSKSPYKGKTKKSKSKKSKRSKSKSKRCPNGSRKNPRTKKCEKKSKKQTGGKTYKTKRCPNGSRKNTKTGKCIKKKTKKTNKKSKKSKNSNSSSSGLNRWFSEKWVNVCVKKGKSYKPCGRKSVKNSKLYPYCRPLHRINSKTPMTVGELKKKYGKDKIKKMCKKKNTGNSKRRISR